MKTLKFALLASALTLGIAGTALNAAAEDQPTPADTHAAPATDATHAAPPAAEATPAPTAATTSTPEAAPAAAPAETAAQIPAATFDETKINAYAKTALKVGAIQSELGPQIEATADAQKKQELMQSMQTRMIDAVEQTGNITVAEYNAISMEVRNNQDLANRVIDAMKKEEAATASGTAPAPATPAAAPAEVKH